MYKFAVQNKLRFPSSHGDLTVEQLFDLSLKSKSGFDLNSVAIAIHTELKGVGEESFVDDNSADPRKKVLEVSLEIVKDVIKTKQEENAAKIDKAKRAEKRAKILDAMEEQESRQLSTATREELEKRLAELDS